MCYTKKKKGGSMDFVLKENFQIEQLKKIFQENSQNNAFDDRCLTSPDFLKIVCLFNNIPVGYVAIYPHNDFIKREGFNFTFKVEDNAIYIWHIAVKKAFEGKGVASTLMQEIIERYSAQPIYSVMEEMNTPSVMIHSRLGFKPFAKFQKNYDGTSVNLLIMKRA